jgi:predicted phospho-2-dehydro-3-deoxyheptonate aldolase
MLGKKRRMRRILKNGRTLIAPMDHGISKPARGLEDMDRILRMVDCGADAVVVHKGVAKNSEYLAETSMSLIIHLSASTSLKNPDDKRIVTSVEKAIELGADAVSIHVNVGSETERDQLVEAGKIAEICDTYGMPLLAMMYPRGKNIQVNAETVKHAVRVGYELGADIIKTCYTGNAESFMEVTDVSAVPVVIAGGSKITDIKLLEEVRDALRAGAAGVAVGRNIFQHSHPDAMVKALSRLIHNDNVEIAKEVLYERDMAALHGR